MTGVLGQETSCFTAGSVAGAAIGAFIGALLLVAAAYYLRKLYLKKKKGKHLVFTKDPESVKDEFAFDNPGFRQEEASKGWQHEAPTLPMAGKNHSLQAQFTRADGLNGAVSKDDFHLQRGRIRRVKLWARDFTGLGLRCSGGAREGVRVHSVLKSGPAAAADLRPGDKIKSIKIEFTGTPLEDAIGIISLASPYPVELEVVEGGRTSGEGKTTMHPLLRRAGSTSDVNSLEREARRLHPPKSPNTSNTSQYNNSTLEAKGKGIKKIITEKIITTTTLERNKKEKKDAPTSTLERENEKNKMISEAPMGRTEKQKHRLSSDTDVQMTQPGNGIHQVENAETQKKDYDPKRGMKFGIRVLPPNVPDDGVLKNKNVENGNISTEQKSIDEVDRHKPTAQIRHENETEKPKPVVAKRREKMAPPIPNARNKPSDTISQENSRRTSDTSMTSFTRNDLNSSGIKRDENGIPQELPQHMLQAANAAISNRKSTSDLVHEKEQREAERREAEAPKSSSKKSKGKAPSPPELERNKTDDSILEQLKNVKDFLKNELQHSSLLYDSSLMSNDTTLTSYNTSTPKGHKTKSSRYEESINFSQDDINDIVSKPFKRESDSLNNYYEESKSNMSSNLDMHSVVSFNNSDKSDKGSTTIELNNSDITIHSSPLNETVHSTSDEASILEENERKAASLGDLSRCDLRLKAKPCTGTLERAQSLDISGDDTVNHESSMTPKKRKANSVIETTFFESSGQDTLPDMISTDRDILKHKEPRLSLNIAKTSAMEGLNTFQRNRLKKGSEFGNLEDAIMKTSNSSIESDKLDAQESQRNRAYADFGKEEDQETSDHLARRIMDENRKVHLKLVSEFAKSTSDNSNVSSLDGSQPGSRATSPPNKDSPTYDTNIPDDMKVSRNSYVNSLERPKSDMMKKLLAKNPILNVHMDKTDEVNDPQSQIDTSKTINQPDIVNFDLKASQKNEDEFVSNIRVGSQNSLKYNKPLYDSFMEWTEQTPKDARGGNIVTISTNDKSPEKISKSYTKSIEISDPNLRRIPDVIEGIKRHVEEEETADKGNRTLYMEAPSMAITMSQEPVQKTVTVNVAEDEFGNKVITQNVEKISTNYYTTKAEIPLQVEQMSFGIIKNPDDDQQIRFELGEELEKDIDKQVLEEIKKQNPNMHIMSDEPAFTKTETIILNTQLDEEQAMILMDKIKNDPNFMAHKTPEELSQLGIRIIHDLEDIQQESHDTVEVTKTRYTLNPAAMTDTCSDKHVTEIHVMTSKTLKEKDKISSRQRAPSEPQLSYELDTSLLDDFITNEKHHTAKQYEEKKSNDGTNEPKKRHSDYDLPRNSRIQFRTATYESPKGTIMTSTDLENRRQSQLDQLRTSYDQTDSSSPPKPSISAKPSNIPVKMSEKPKRDVNTSKIPVFKSLSQENLVEKNFSLPRSPPPKLSGSSGNISVTSIKTSSKNPSGKL